MTSVGLADRFPALASLGASAFRRDIPWIVQTTAADCGAACLGMALAFHGRRVELEELRARLGVGRDGTNLRSLLETAALFGLEAQAVQVELDELRYLERGSILHWRMDHFVVFDRIDETHLHFVDPACGYRRITLKEASRYVTGVAVNISKGKSFVKGGAHARPLWRYLRSWMVASSSWWRIVLVSFFVQTLAALFPVLNGRLVDRVIPQADRHLLLVLGVGLGWLIVFLFATQLVRSNLLLNLRTQLDARLTLGFLDHLAKLPFAFFQARPTGDLLLRVHGNEVIREALAVSVLSSVLDGTLVIFYGVVLIIVSPPIALAAGAFALVQVMLSVVVWRTQRTLVAELHHRQALSETFLVEAISGMETLKSMGVEQRSMQQFSSLYVDVLNTSLKRGRVNAWLDSLLATVRSGAPFVFLTLGTMQVLDGRASLGTMLAAVALATQFIIPISGFLATFTQLQLVVTLLDRIDDVFRAEPEQEEGCKLPGRFAGGISVRNLSFRYSAGAPTVVRDVSIDIRPGQLVAIVGRSGSGKSTLASLLFGLYRPSAGTVEYDGADLASLDLRAVRKQLGIVIQRPFLFSSSVRTNITLGDPLVSGDEVREAARLACIDADIDAMPMAYDTLLAPGGGGVSGGQAQRLVLARALARKPPLLLLDEPTSALDSVTEKRIFEHLAGIGCTRIVVAHRLSTIRNADQILVMEAGSIVEAGTHESLLARGGAYATLVAGQVASPGLDDTQEIRHP